MKLITLRKKVIWWAFFFYLMGTKKSSQRARTRKWVNKFPKLTPRKRTSNGSNWEWNENNDGSSSKAQKASGATHFEKGIIERQKSCRFLLALRKRPPTSNGSQIGKQRGSFLRSNHRYPNWRSFCFPSTAAWWYRSVFCRKESAPIIIEIFARYFNEREEFWTTINLFSSWYWYLQLAQESLSGDRSCGTVVNSHDLTKGP